MPLFIAELVDTKIALKTVNFNNESIKIIIRIFLRLEERALEKVSCSVY